MNEKSIKIEDNTLSEIKMLQGKFQESVFKLGNHQIEKMELDRLVTEFVDKEKKLKEEWLSLQSLEKGLLDRIVAKYGTGNLDLATGTFVPAPEKVG